MRRNNTVVNQLAKQMIWPFAEEYGLLELTRAEPNAKFRELASELRSRVANGKLDMSVAEIQSLESDEHLLRQVLTKVADLDSFSNITLTDEIPWLRNYFVLQVFISWTKIATPIRYKTKLSISDPLRTGYED